MNDLFENFQQLSFSEFADEILLALDKLHFIRADWFYAFIPLIIFLVLSNRKTLSAKNWNTTIDKQLLPFVLTRTGSKRRRYPLLLTFIAVSLCITALAGPVYKKLPQPVYREQSSLVVLLDLSQSMNAADVKPSRLSRAKLELLDILNTRKTGQTALIVYAADAFVVTPLTDDNATIANLVPSLATDMMPAQGSNLSNALVKTFSLFTQAGIVKGDILVITDGIHQRHADAITKVSSQGHRLSIFGVGTTAGGPIPLDETLDGGFLLDKKGAIVIPKLQADTLRRYALSGSGIYTGLTAGDRDIEKLTRLFQSKDLAETPSEQDLNADVWQEEGHWLLLPLLFFAALWSRKGWLAVTLPITIVFSMATPAPAYAEGIDTQHLWSSPDQKAMQAFNAGDTKTAADQFTQAEWKASAHYRNSDFEAAVEALKDIKSSDAYYNKGNALAKLGQYQEAIKAYDEALALDENNEDASHNKEQVKQALEQQKQQQDQSEQNDEQESDESDESQSQEKNEDGQTGENQQDQDKNEQQSEQSAEDQQDGEQENQDQQKPSDQQQSEEKQLKQRDAEQEEAQEQEEKQQYEQDQKDSAENDEIENKDSEEKPAEIEINPMEASISEEEKATEQWLKRIPDDPGGLLRRKFLYQYKQIPNQKDENEPW